MPRAPRPASPASPNPHFLSLPAESAPQVAAGAKPTARGSYAAADVSYATPVSYPPHERCVEVGVDLGVPGGAAAMVLGSDLTHEYVAENADYRS